MKTSFPHIPVFSPRIELFSLCLWYFLMAIPSRRRRRAGCGIRDNVPFSGRPSGCSCCSSLLAPRRRSSFPQRSGCVRFPGFPTLRFCSLVADSAAREEALYDHVKNSLLLAISSEISVPIARCSFSCWLWDDAVTQYRSCLCACSYCPVLSFVSLFRRASVFS